MDVNLTLILLAALVAGASPGPATLAIAGTSMSPVGGRRAGLALAAGITCGSLAWSVAAAFGLGAVMLANGWMFEVIRYIGSGYLLWLALKSARGALSPKALEARAMAGTIRGLFLKGLALHLTNPKAILFFGSLYAIGIPPGASPAQLMIVIAAVGLQSALTFHGYALLFSVPAMTRAYIRLRRPFEAAFAACFGLAGVKILTARLA
ncbi:Threonine/homoserine/homoserine lactone efflux protein [Jannaschia faecimaris]|uniref:Threonine/homoserine/homoserine lactone efflux protein n=1 Tax=Jannaschia faecimaris TaxID=1244108 RepID=A0A1H3QYS8_9RHOB|nr:LysE family transporter [Jannaschia faecimaris]SDZ18118.1 Threonine/homoserine/homoserine lactone efflux protein [Jannaschia faecimaris]